MRFFNWLFSSLAKFLDAGGQTKTYKPQEPHQAPTENWPPEQPSSSAPAVAPVVHPGPVGVIPPEAYDVGHYTPISRDELHAEADRLGPRWTNPWFGRQDLIPPADDPRTRLIDRAMVTHGFITPEELEDIHEVGAELDAVRPLMLHAAQQANRIVEQTQQARADRKQQKRAEAAERKRQRQADIAERRQADIVFLGRGVSMGLADRRANVEQLQKFDLPILATPGDLAKALELSIPRLRWLAFHNVASVKTHYIRFSVPKKSGGLRQLAKPHREMDRCQRWILANILQKIPVHPAAHGFVTGRSTVTGAAVHTNQAAVVNCDLEEFFPSITFPRVMGFFRRAGYSPAVATILRFSPRNVPAGPCY